MIIARTLPRHQTMFSAKLPMQPTRFSQDRVYVAAAGPTYANSAGGIFGLVIFVNEYSDAPHNLPTGHGLDLLQNEGLGIGLCLGCARQKECLYLHSCVQRRAHNVIPPGCIDLSAEEIDLFKIDNAVINSISVVFSAGGDFDFIVTAIKQIDGLRGLFTEAVPQGGDRNPTVKDPASVRHRKTNMRSRVRINDRGPARITDDRHGRPLRVLSGRGKYPLYGQQIVRVKRPMDAGFYFQPDRVVANKFLPIRCVITFWPVNHSRAVTDYGVLIRWKPLARADALDIAGAA
jgi:hypothetical protein